ncbi:MAG: MFS transporter, partial [bacterium]
MEARWAELWAVERRAATATVALGVVLFAFNAFVVSTALPRAVAEFGGTRWLAWATSLYIICAIVTGPSAAMVMQRVGARAMFMASGGVFLAGTLLAAAAPGMAWLLAGRAMQGAAAGFIESGCYVLIPRLFPSRLIPRVFGIEAVCWAVAAFAAPALAGFLAEALSWRVALLTSVPMVLIFLILVPKVVGGREVADGAVSRLPILSLLGVAGGMGLIVLSDGVGGLNLRLFTVAAGFALFVAVVRADGRWGERLVPRGAFSLRRKMGLGLWVALLMPLSETVEAVFLVYMLQFLWNFTPLQAGLSASVLALSWSATQMLTAQIRGDRSWLVVAGAGLMVVGQAVMFAAFWQGSVLTMLAGLLVLG